MNKYSSNGEIFPDKAKIALNLSHLIGMNIMLNSEEGVSVTSVNSIKVVSSSEDPLIIALYTSLGVIIISDNKKMKEILVINAKGHAETLYSLISDVVYF